MSHAGITQASSLPMEPRFHRGKSGASRVSGKTGSRRSPGGASLIQRQEASCPKPHSLLSGRPNDNARSRCARLESINLCANGGAESTADAHKAGPRWERTSPRQGRRHASHKNRKGTSPRGGRRVRPRQHSKRRAGMHTALPFRGDQGCWIAASGCRRANRM